MDELINNKKDSVDYNEDTIAYNTSTVKDSINNIGTINDNGVTIDNIFYDKDTIDYKIFEIKRENSEYINNNISIKLESIVKHISTTLEIDNESLLEFAINLNKKHRFKIDKNKKMFIENINSDLNINLKLTKLNYLIKNEELKKRITIFKEAIGIYQVKKLFDNYKNYDEFKQLVKKLLLLMNDKIKTMGDVREINIKG